MNQWKNIKLNLWEGHYYDIRYSSYWCFWYSSCLRLCIHQKY